MTRAKFTAPPSIQVSNVSGAARALRKVNRVQFELRRLDTGGLVHQYDTESAALGFVRDVIRVGGHDQAACFALDERDSQGRENRIAEGVDLVWRALQDRANPSADTT